uniref:Paraflagellar rod protein n=1 Tax=Eutreptiella gymnastica TaxID=73025 RepID=A0A7S4CVR6_9EUGL
MSPLRQLEEYLMQHSQRYSCMLLRKEAVGVQLKAATMLQDFEAEDTANPRLYDETQLLIDLDQELSAQQLEAVCSGEVLELQNAEYALKRLCSLQNDYSDALRTGLTQIHKKLQRVIQNAADDKSNLSEIGGLLTLQIQHLESILSRHSLREMVAVVDDEIAQVTNRVDDCDIKSREALEAGESALGEGYYHTKFEHLEQLRALTESKSELIRAELQWMDKTVREAMDKRQSAHHQIRSVNARYSNMARRVQQDLTQLEDGMKDRGAVQTASLEDRQAMLADSEAWLRKNQQKQDDAWSKLCTLEVEMCNLAKDRMRELQRRWELTECWRDQVGSEVPYTTFYKDRLKMVARSKKAITTAEWCCAQIQEISKSLAETTKRALESQRTLSTGPLEDKADLDHFHTFRRLYLGLGDLIFKKEKVVGEVERAAMQSHVHLEFCKDTFDPMAKEHKEEIELHQRTVTALEQEIAVLRRQMQTALDMVRPVEARIKTKGLDLGLHPVDELQDTLIGKSKKMLLFRELRRAAKGHEMEPPSIGAGCTSFLDSTAADSLQSMDAPLSPIALSMSPNSSHVQQRDRPMHIFQGWSDIELDLTSSASMNP